MARRPRTSADIEAHVCRMARENTSRGYRRIQGELLKIDIKLSKGCIADIRRRNDLPPSPERRGLTWREFLSRHADALLCCDFFTKEVWTCCGLRTAYVLFVMHLETRRIILAEAPFSPHASWIRQMSRNVLMECDDLGIEPRFIVHGRDVLFGHGFDRVMESAAVQPVRTPFGAPNANASAERRVRSVRRECVSHLIFIFFGLRHLQEVLDTYTHSYRISRPHQVLATELPNHTVADRLLNIVENHPSGKSPARKNSAACCAVTTAKSRDDRRPIPSRHLGDRGFHVLPRSLRVFFWQTPPQLPRFLKKIALNVPPPHDVSAQTIQF